MKRTNIVIGTRGSKLAMIYAENVKNELKKYFSKNFKPYVIGKIIKGQKKVSLNGSINWLKKN